MRLPRALRRWRNPLWQLSLANTYVLTRAGSSMVFIFIMPILLAVFLGVAFRGQDGQARVRVLVTEGADGDALVERLKLTGVPVERTTYEAGVHELEAGEAILLVKPGPNAEVVAGNRKPIVAGKRYVDFAIPGLLGFSIFTQALTLAYTVVFLRQGRLLRRMVATPMNRAHLMISIAGVRAVMALAICAFVVIASMLLFGMRATGDVLSLGAFVVLATLAFGGIGVLIGSRTDHQQVVGGIVSLLSLGMLVTAGVFFPIQNFPSWLQVPLDYLPMSALTSGLRAIMNEGKSIVGVGREVIILAVYGVIGFGLGLKIFRWS